MSSENVVSCWSIICNLEARLSDNLLTQLAKNWVTLRGFAYTENLFEQYKKCKAVTSKGKKGLRKTLKLQSDN